MIRVYCIVYPARRINFTVARTAKPMREEAASSGFYESPFMGKHYPRIQILTIAEILEGKRIEFPESANVTFKKAGTAKSKDMQAKLFE